MAGTADGLYFDYEGQNDAGQQYSQPHPSTQSQHSRLSWPIPSSTQHQQNQAITVSSSPQMGMNAYKRSSSPLPLPMGGQHAFPDTSVAANQLMSNWQMNNNHMPAVSLGIDTSAAFQASTFDNYGGMSFQASPQEIVPHQQAGFLGQNAVDHAALNQPGLDVNNLNVNTSMPMENFMNIPSDLAMPNLQQMSMMWPNVDTSFLPSYTDPTAQVPEFSQQPQQSLSVGSPSNYSDYIEVSSIPSSDNGSIEKWQLVNHHHHHPQTIFNPGGTLHTRTGSDSSQSDYEQQLRESLGSMESFVDIDLHQLNSPSSDSGPDSVYSDQGLYPNHQKPSPPPLLSTGTKPIMIQRPNSQRKSPTSPTSNRPTRVTKPSHNKAGVATKTGTSARRGPANGTGRDEKRVGRRKGPLNPDQRKQAGEIRKLGACIRCRFLKKTCDKGDPCAGCQPSHARLWLVPCTRVDIKDLGYFLKGWKADYERHVTLAVSITNVKSFGDVERKLYVTHGYGHYFPITAREVYVRDESVFGVNWVEAHTGQHEEFKIGTAHLSAGSEGISTSMLSEYLDMHIDGGFEHFVDEHFQGTPFITEMLKIAYRFYTKEKTPVIRKALKLVLAYNLTQAILLVQGIPMEEEMEGKIDDPRSEFNGQTAAPMMINFQVKTAMADLWRELQKSLLEDLSQLYSSIYSKDKLKHWPTIFMIASVLLVVWEEMQFDCRYRIPDEKVVDKFCHDMESTPVGVIVGLFSAISQKVPAFTEWDTAKHHALLNSNRAVCEAMEDVREGLKKHDKYLRNRNQAKFDRQDFDSLSNTFVSKLVIRAH